MTDFDVVIGDPWSLDVDALLNMFGRWLAGRTAAEAAQERLADMRRTTERHLLELESFENEDPDRDQNNHGNVDGNGNGNGAGNGAGGGGGGGGGGGDDDAPLAVGLAVKARFGGKKKWYAGTIDKVRLSGRAVGTCVVWHG